MMPILADRGFAPAPDDFLGPQTLITPIPDDLPDTRFFVRGSERKSGVPKAESPVWRDLKAFKGAVKTNGLNGSKRRYYEWDHLHDDIELYDSSKNHLGSLEPLTGELYKGPVPGRRLKIRS